MNDKEMVEKLWSCGRFFCGGDILAMKLHYGDWHIRCLQCEWTGIALAREIKQRSEKSYLEERKGVEL